MVEAFTCVIWGILSKLLFSTGIDLHASLHLIACNLYVTICKGLRDQPEPAG